MTTILTQEQIENFPVAHLSPSAIREYLSNPQAFFMRYVRYVFDTRKGAAMIEGDCVHRVLAAYYAAGDPQAFNWHASAIDQINTVLIPEQGSIDFGKTGSFEKSRDNVLQAAEFYFSDLPEHRLGEIIAVEYKMVSDFEDLDGNPMPIPLKGYIDLGVLHGEEADIVDHKIVSAFTELGPDGKPKDPADVAKYEMQAAPYFFLFRKAFGKNPRRMIFDEVKKTKNRDGSPQIQSVIVEYTPVMLNRWLEVYRRVVRSLAGMPLIDPKTGVMQFLPNPFVQYGGGDAWKDFCEEVDSGKTWTLHDIKSLRSSFATADDVDSAF